MSTFSPARALTTCLLTFLLHIFLHFTPKFKTILFLYPARAPGQYTPLNPPLSGPDNGHSVHLRFFCQPHLGGSSINHPSAARPFHSNWRLTSPRIRIKFRPSSSDPQPSNSLKTKTHLDTYSARWPSDNQILTIIWTVRSAREQAFALRLDFKWRVRSLQITIRIVIGFYKRTDNVWQLAILIRHRFWAHLRCFGKTRLYI